MTFKRCPVCHRKLKKPDHIHFRSHFADVSLLNRGGFMECYHCDRLYTLSPNGDNKPKVVTMIKLE
jgi:uncharacterized protein with PIN domain